MAAAIPGPAIAPRLRKTKEQKETILAGWRKDHPNLYYLVASDRVGLNALQDNLAADEAVLAYFISEKELYLWLLTGTDLKMYSVGIEKAKLLELIAAYRSQIEKTAGYRQLSRSLYQTLFAPLEKELTQIGRIYLVPHLNLHYLPFASLYDGEKFLVEKFQLIQLPQANLLPYCRSLSRPGIQNVLAFGNPKTGRKNDQLPFSEKEVKSIARSFSRTTGLVGEKATESVFKKLAGGYQAVHFGSHGKLAPQSPLFSALELAPDEDNDGHLRVREILGMKLTAQLVTLSACQTGLGNQYQGEEISGLNRAFLFAGVPGVVSTLWRVNDVTAAVITKRFYRYLSGNDRAAALQKAQLLVKKYYPHPVYWAAFTLTGTP